MRSKGNSPNKAQVDFRENLRKLYPGAEIHHMYGASAQVKIDFVSTNIGHLAIMAINAYNHKLLHTSPDRRRTEKNIWTGQMRYYKAEYGELPFSEEIYDSIRGYHK